MYADDSTFHLSGKSVTEIQGKIQSDLNSINRQCSENKMYMNTEKTKFMTVGTRQKLSFLVFGSIVRFYKLLNVKSYWVLKKIPPLPGLYKLIRYAPLSHPDYISDQNKTVLKP